MTDGGTSTADGEADAKKTYLVGQEGSAGQGPFMLLVLTVAGGRIEDARFQTYACPAAVACGNFVAEWVTGRTCAEAAALDAGLIETGVGHMPLGREHCPVLAARALRAALAQAGSPLPSRDPQSPDVAGG